MSESHITEADERAILDAIDKWLEQKVAPVAMQLEHDDEYPAELVQDMIDLGLEAAKHFDRIIVREDERLRGRAPGETAGLIVQGAKEAQAQGGRVKQIETVLDEIESTRAAVEWANPGDLVVVCVDRARAVWDELQVLAKRAQPADD